MKFSLSTLVFFVFCCFFSRSFSQNEAQKWYFGNQAGLDFSTNPPTVLTNGVMSTGEGCASISDAAGNILFYTDGLTVYNQLHVTMANGTGLMGNGSTTQSGIIVKQPGNNTIYYVFTQDDTAGPDGFRYSIVDMSLAAGMGSVTVKNFSLYTPSCEKITAVRHCNGNDVWVVSHDWNSNNFRTYLVTAAGVSVTPVVSSVGAVITGTPAVAYRSLGQMKISPNGRTLGLAIYDNSYAAPFEVYDFDPSTGMVSNPVVLGNALSNYGCEFSPDGTKFYGGVYSGGKIFQWDLCAGSATAIVASVFTITPGGSTLSYASLQLASDGKIYVARSGQTLALIQNPNGLGAACNYTDNGISIAPKNSALGLPNFINSFFKQAIPPVTHTVSCQTVNFTAPQSPTFNVGCTASGYSLSGIQWNFGEPSSGAANTSSLNNPVHTYSTIGMYTVQYIQYTQCSSDTLKFPVTIQSIAPSLSLTGVFSICKGDKRVYTASGGTSYTWSPAGIGNTTTISLTPTVSTAYTVSATTGTSGGCISNKTFTLTVNKCLGMEEFSNSTYRVFPNPLIKVLNIENEEKIWVLLMDVAGKLIFETEFEAGMNSINIEQFSPGMYLLKIKDSQQTQLLKLVKTDGSN